jgi:ACS family hexuronate transporter-like MFS transporter
MPSLCCLLEGLIDKVGTKAGSILAIIVWSIGAIMHAYAITIGKRFITLFVCAGIATVPVSILGFMISRSFLAIGEAGNFPGAIKAVADYFSKKERSLATGIFSSGSNVGAILAPLTVPWIAVNWGWESTFIIIGAIGFIWMFFWYILYEKPEKQKRLSQAELEYILDGETIEETVET